jgi:hypothetical protein
MQKFLIAVMLCVLWVHVTNGAEPLPPSAQRALKVAQEAYTPLWALCGDTVNTQALLPDGSKSFGFHQMAPVVWEVAEVYLMASDGTGGKEKIYQVSAYTARYRSWRGTWTPWNTGMPWEVGKIEIFNARVTLPDTGVQTQASQYFIFTDGAFRKPLCTHIPAG